MDHDIAFLLVFFPLLENKTSCATKLQLYSYSYLGFYIDIRTRQVIFTILLDLHLQFSNLISVGQETTYRGLSTLPTFIPCELHRTMGQTQFSSLLQIFSPLFSQPNPINFCQVLKYKNHSFWESTVSPPCRDTEILCFRESTANTCS